MMASGVGWRAMAALSGATLCTCERLSRDGSAWLPRRGVHALHTVFLFRLSPKVGKNPFDLSNDNGVCEVFPRHVGEHRVAHLSIRIGVIEEDGAGLPEAERGLIEIPNRAQPLRLSEFFGFGQNIRDHQVEQVEGIV